MSSSHVFVPMLIYVYMDMYNDIHTSLEVNISMSFAGKTEDLRDKLEELAYQGPLTVGTLDIDCFEDLNNKFGRDCGDTVLVCS